MFNHTALLTACGAPRELTEESQKYTCLSELWASVGIYEKLQILQCVPVASRYKLVNYGLAVLAGMTTAVMRGGVALRPKHEVLTRQAVRALEAWWGSKGSLKAANRVVSLSNKLNSAMQRVERSCSFSSRNEELPVYVLANLLIVAYTPKDKDAVTCCQKLTRDAIDYAAYRCREYWRRKKKYSSADMSKEEVELRNELKMRFNREASQIFENPFKDGIKI